mmetsp:Transcript_10725/g.28649  ORF Transcript_10725/g.28649 Transcript_10725/m.28649 type:complete len:139 (+) Transcript_10725:206-622(+)
MVRFSAVILALCLAVTTQAFAPTRAFSKGRVLMSTNDLYQSAPPATGQGQQVFGGTFSQGSGLAAPGRGRQMTADSTILVQGGSLRTWSYRSPLVEQVQVVLSTEGRPLDADIELWHGPDNTPWQVGGFRQERQVPPL